MDTINAEYKTEKDFNIPKKKPEPTPFGIVLLPNGKGDLKRSLKYLNEIKSDLEDKKMILNRVFSVYQESVDDIPDDIVQIMCDSNATFSDKMMLVPTQKKSDPKDKLFKQDILFFTSDLTNYTIDRLEKRLSPLWLQPFTEAAGLSGNSLVQEQLDKMEKEFKDKYLKDLKKEHLFDKHVKVRNDGRPLYLELDGFAVKVNTWNQANKLEDDNTLKFCAKILCAGRKIIHQDF